MVNDWHPEDIKAAVRKKGVNLLQLDRNSRLRPKTCARTLYTPHRRAERAIARLLGVHPMALWPSRYDEKGRRLKPQPLANWQFKKSRSAA
jgi:Ner family transcriptional regulator